MMSEQLPGELLAAGPRRAEVQQYFADLCGLKAWRFPGSQPTPLDASSVHKLKRGNYWVCEKTDGVRVLLLVRTSHECQEVYMVDRKNSWRQLHHMPLLRQDHMESRHLTNTILDGEYVVDTDAVTGARVPCLLLFDCLAVNGQRMTLMALSSRYEQLQVQVVTPHEQMIKRSPWLLAKQPFQLALKEQDQACNIATVLRERIPLLKHSTDGLIFSCADAPYTYGTDYNTLKWKAPSAVSIDFRLELKFPPMTEDAAVPDLTAKPAFRLLANHAPAPPQYFDVLDVPDDQWTEWKRSGEQYDDRIVEVTWDKCDERWVFQRLRTDKLEGNHITVVEDLIRCIQRGVECHTLLTQSSGFRRSGRRQPSHAKWDNKHTGRHQHRAIAGAKSPHPTCSYFPQYAAQHSARAIDQPPPLPLARPPFVKARLQQLPPPSPPMSPPPSPLPPLQLKLSHQQSLDTAKPRHQPDPSARLPQLASPRSSPAPTAPPYPRPPTSSLPQQALVTQGPPPSLGHPQSPRPTPQTHGRAARSTAKTMEPMTILPMSSRRGAQPVSLVRLQPDIPRSPSSAAGAGLANDASRAVGRDDSRTSTSTASPAPITIRKRPPRNKSDQPCSSDGQLCAMMGALAC